MYLLMIMLRFQSFNYGTIIAKNILVKAIAIGSLKMKKEEELKWKDKIQVFSTIS